MTSQELKAAQHGQVTYSYSYQRGTWILLRLMSNCYKGTQSPGSANRNILIAHTELPKVEVMEVHALDDYYLAITLLITIGYQLCFFSIAWTFKFDKLTGKIFFVISSERRPLKVRFRLRWWHQLCRPCDHNPSVLRPTPCAPNRCFSFHNDLGSSALWLSTFPYSQDWEGRSLR